MHKIAAYSALAMAGCLLALQILLGLEYTQGGSLGTQASMICAMVTLAALPVFIEAARHTGNKGAAVALSIAFIAWLIYSLPATTGRTGEIKEVKVSAASDVVKLKDDLERSTKQAEWARQDWIAECGTGDGKKCRGKRNTVQALDDRVEKLTVELAKMPKAAGDVGSDLWAWALAPIGATADVVRKVSVMAFAIGLDMVIWALIWLATSILSRRPAVSDVHGQSGYPANFERPAWLDRPAGGYPVKPDRPVMPDDPKTAVLAAITTDIALGRTLESQRAMAKRYGVPTSTLSDWLKEWETDGSIPTRRTVGRCKMIEA